MRVISGKAKGRNLLTVPGDTTRPVLSRVRTAVFDALMPYLDDAVFLDLFAGSGSIGIEALSRGAKHATFCDLARPAIDTIRQNLESTQLTAQATVRQIDAFSFLRSTRDQFDLIYIAPPQYKGLWVEALRTLAERPDLISPTGRVLVQIDPKEFEPLGLTTLRQSREKTYGNTMVVWFERT